MIIFINLKITKSKPVTTLNSALFFGALLNNFLSITHGKVILRPILFA